MSELNNINEINEKKEKDKVNDKEKVDIKEKIKEQNKKDKIRNFASFFLFGLAAILGYSGKYGIAIGFTKYRQDNIIMIKNETIHNNTETIFGMDEEDIISYNYNL